MGVVVCVDNYVVALLDESVVVCLDNNNNNDFDVPNIIARPLV